MARTTANGSRQEEEDADPLEIIGLSETGIGLLALERVTPWGLRTEYIDVTLGCPVYAEYSARPRSLHNIHRGRGGP
ncbi:MAG: hypothetical protein ACYS0G_11160 [Planctomycetota bacterium]|jgi:hypothetical protein